MNVGCLTDLPFINNNTDWEAERTTQLHVTFYPISKTTGAVKVSQSIHMFRRANAASLVSFQNAWKIYFIIFSSSSPVLNAWMQLCCYWLSFVMWCEVSCQWFALIEINKVFWIWINYSSSSEKLFNSFFLDISFTVSPPPDLLEATS